MRWLLIVFDLLMGEFQSQKNILAIGTMNYSYEYYEIHIYRIHVQINRITSILDNRG